MSLANAQMLFFAGVVVGILLGILVGLIAFFCDDDTEF